MKTKKSDFVEQVTFRINAEVVGAIQKSGQSAPDWFRQAARNRIDGERRVETGVSGAMDTAGEFDDEESYAAVAIGAREAKADRRVLAQGRSVSQASTRATFMAMTVNTC